MIFSQANTSLTIHLLLLACLAQLTHQVDFRGKSFSVRSTVSVNDNQQIFSYRIHESYSVEQQRAKLSYKLTSPIPSLPEEGTFYLDNNNHAALLLDNVAYRCTESSFENITSLLGLSKFSPSNDDLSTEKYIIGPARVLFYVTEHKDELKYLGPTKSRNHQAILYELKVETAQSNIKLYVYYDEILVIDDPSAFPIQVLISRIDDGESYSAWMYFSRLELIPLANSGPVSDVNNALLKSETQLDPFVFPLVAGCSGALVSKTSLLFADRSKGATRFSFKSEVEFIVPVNKAPVARSIKSFVAFDSALGSLRFDLEMSQQDSGVRRQLLNFKLNRMYHSIEIVSESWNIVDKVFELNQNDATISSTQCQVGRILVPDRRYKEGENVEQPSIGRILVGADKFLYMGRALVRGVPAKVYEAHEVSPPIWWDQPVAYQTTSGEWRLREPHTGAATQSEGSSYDIVVYVSDQDEQGPLLLMEMYKLRGKVSSSNDKESVRFYDFLWDLNHEAPNGDRPSQLFSLEDFCSSDLAQNQYARVDLLLAPKSPTSSTNLSCADGYKLESTEERHLALLAGLQQEFNLASTMIYDLQSRLLGSEGLGTEEQSQLNVALSFRVAEHPDDLVRLVYVGQGRIRRDYKGMRSTAFRRSFQACYFLAAHRSVDVYFGYDMEQKLCSVDLEQATGPFNGREDPTAFIMDPRNSMEIYRTSRTIDPIDAKSSDWLETMSRPEEKHKIIGKNLKLNQVGPENTDLEFVVKRARIDDQDYKTSLGEKGTRMRTDMIRGFGLVESSRLCKRILPTALRSTHQSPLSSYLKDSRSQMTYEQCQAACLNDMSCQSYSVCLRDSELRCVTSSLSLRSESTIQQLQDAIKVGKDSKRRRLLEIKMDDDEEVKLSQDPNCQLYNKIYLQLFREPISDIGRNLNMRRLHPVQSEEACAKLCLEKNIKLLNDDLSQARYSSLDDKEMSAKLSEMRSSQRNATNQFCKAFLYLDRLRLRGEVDESMIYKRLIESKRDKVERSTGLCIINDQQSRELADTMSENDKIVNMDLYQFKTEIFYEKQFSIALNASIMTDEEVGDYRKALRHSESTVVGEASLSRLNSLIARGHNFQERFFGVDESSCALACLMQSWGPWPACRSFDVAYEEQDLKKTSRVVCYLNSVTIHEAEESERFDLIKGPDERQHQLWHFEPRSGFVMEESDLSADMRETDLAQMLRNPYNLKFHSFNLFMFIIAGLGTGFFLGVKLGANISVLQRLAREDHDLLV